MRTKESDIVKIFLLIDEKEIERAVNKTAYIKSYKPDKWKIKNTEGM